MEITEPRQRWVVSRTPPINPAFALVEVFWIAAGRRDSHLPSYWNPALTSYCGSTTELLGAYGYRLRSRFGFDQLDRIFKVLQARPDTRQGVLQIWDPSIDFPYEDGTPSRADIPCNVMAIPKIRAGRLEWLQVMRSNDIFRGLPYNFVQFTSLQEILAGWLEIPAGSYHQVSDSLHAYAPELSAIRASTVAIPLPASTDSLALTRTDWERVIGRVIKRVERMASQETTLKDFRTIAFESDVPEPYENAIKIIGADAARRRGWGDIAAECAEQCCSAVLRALWGQWYARVHNTAARPTPAELATV
jgi:thymidylate synthase